MGQNKAQRAAAKRAAQPTSDTTTTTNTIVAGRPDDPQLLAWAKQDAKQEEAKGDDQTIVVTSQALQDAIDLCGAKVTSKANKANKAPKPAQAPRPVCTATKKDGTKCTSRAKEGKETCVDHQPAWDRLTHDEHVAFGKWLRGAKGPEIVEVIGWWKAKQIAKDVTGEPTTPEQDAVEK